VVVVSLVAPKTHDSSWLPQNPRVPKISIVGFDLYQFDDLNEAEIECDLLERLVVYFLWFGRSDRMAFSDTCNRREHQ